MSKNNFSIDVSRGVFIVNFGSLQFINSSVYIYNFEQVFTCWEVLKNSVILVFFPLQKRQ